MTRFLYVFAVFNFFSYFLGIFDFFFNDILYIHSDNKNIFIFYFLFLFFINFFLIRNIPNFNFNSDLIYKFNYLMFKKPGFFLNYITNNFKKIWLFFVHFKYHREGYVIRTTISKIYSFFMVFWKPLFKKFSYFGYFRSNRSKWIK